MVYTDIQFQKVYTDQEDMAWKSSKQANMLISTGMPQPESACFGHREGIKFG